MFQTVTTKSEHVKDRCFKTLTLTLTLTMTLTLILTMTLTGRDGGQTERNWFVDCRKRRHTSVQSVGTSHLGAIRTAQGLELGWTGKGQRSGMLLSIFI